MLLCLWHRITTCYGGRNRKCAEAFVKTGKVAFVSACVVVVVVVVAVVCVCVCVCVCKAASALLFAMSVFIATVQTWEQLEVEILDGQKLQGTLTAKEVYEVLSRAGVRHPLPCCVTPICIGVRIAVAALP